MTLDNNYRKHGLVKDVEARLQNPMTLFKLRDVVKFSDRAKSYLINECKEIEHNMILVSERYDVLRLLATGSKVLYEDNDIVIRRSAVLGHMVISNKMCMIFVQDSKTADVLKEIKFYAGNEEQVNESI